MKQIERMLEIFSTFIAGKGERYTIKVDKNGNDSYYSKDRRIVIGLKSALEKLPEREALSIGKALVAHEIGHYRFTEWVKDVKDDELPFSILNVLEDARIERKMIDETIPSLEDYFKKLHSFSFQTVYSGAEGDDVFINPVNLLILCRWSVYGIDTLNEVENRKHLLEVLVKRSYTDRTADELLDDCKKAVQDSISATSTKEVVEVGKKFYKKWKELFNNYFDSPFPIGQGGLTPIGIGDGEGRDGEEVSTEEMDEREKEIERDETEKEKESLPDSSLFLHPEEEAEEVEDFFSPSPYWKWDEKLIREIKNRLKRWRLKSKLVRREYSLTSGKRVAPRRIAQGKLEILKKDTVVENHSSAPKLLFVIDGSGSMRNGGAYTPHYYASHLARALEEEVGADVVITNSFVKRPIWLSDQMERLRYYNYPYGEGLRIVSPLLSRYDYVVFFTDGFVCEEDYEFLRKNRNRFVVVYATGNDPSYPRRVLEGLRKEVKETFEKFTNRYVVTDEIVKTAQELALLLRRLK